MKVYYSDDFATVYHGDFREWEGPLNVAAVITDPPYEETGLAWDVWPTGWPLWVLGRVPAAAALWCWGSLKMFLAHSPEFVGWHLAQDVVWEKSNGSSLHADRFRRVHELAVHFYPARSSCEAVYKKPVIRSVEEDRKRKPILRQGKPAHWNEISRESATYEYDGTRLARSVIPAPAVRHGVRHRTPKPVPILRDLISYSVPPGACMADIMCGSGSALVAAKEMGVHSIGIDGDEEACMEAAERLAQTMALPEVVG